jgi:hypothetical protein
MEIPFLEGGTAGPTLERHVGLALPVMVFLSVYPYLDNLS